VATLEEVKSQLAALQAELNAGLAKAGERTQQSKKQAVVKEGSKKHHIK
jgi:hypothetical protein